MADKYTWHAGHNSFVPGAQANGYREEVETRRVVKRIAEICNENDINYAITTDEVGRTQRQNLNNICANCNSHTKNRVDVAIHFNQAYSEEGGVEVFYYDQQELASRVSSAVASSLGIRNRGAKENKSLAVLNGTNAPAILIEVAFLGHAGNMQAYEQRFEPLCRAIVQSVTGANVKNYQDLPVAIASKSWRIYIGDFNDISWTGQAFERVKEAFPDYPQSIWVECLDGGNHRFIFGDFNDESWCNNVFERVKKLGYGCWKAQI